MKGNKITFLQSSDSDCYFRSDGEINEVFLACAVVEYFSRYAAGGMSVLRLAIIADEKAAHTRAAAPKANGKVVDINARRRQG